MSQVKQNIRSNNKMSAKKKLIADSESKLKTNPSY